MWPALFLQFRETGKVIRSVSFDYQSRIRLQQNARAAVQGRRRNVYRNEAQLVLFTQYRFDHESGFGSAAAAHFNQRRLTVNGSHNLVSITFKDLVFGAGQVILWQQTNRFEQL